MDSPTLPCSPRRCGLTKLRAEFGDTKGQNKGRGQKSPNCKSCERIRQRKAWAKKKADQEELRLTFDGEPCREIKVWPPVIGGMDPQRLMAAGIKEWTFLSDYMEGR